MPPGVPPPSLFFFNDTATTEIYTLSLHDALPIFNLAAIVLMLMGTQWYLLFNVIAGASAIRSEEHTSELQSRPHLVCRLLLENKQPCTSSPCRRPRNPIRRPSR